MKTRYLWVGTGSLAALVSTAAWAGDPAVNALEDVVVTAQKREQRLVDVPMAVAVLSGEEIAERGIESVQDLSFSVPGLTMREDGPGSYTIFLRGLANQSGSGALVGQYLDEAPLTLDGYNQLSPVALDLQRIEVLEGPQGTLYGLGSAAGTIRYITNHPKLDKVEGSIEGTLSDVAHGELGERVIGVINAPLVSGTLGWRLAGSYERGGGWIDQPQAGIKDGNGTRLLNARTELLWKPAEAFDALLMVQLHRADTQLGLGYEEPDRTALVGPDRAQVLIPKQFNFTVMNADLTYHFSFADLVSATTYIDHDHHYPFSYVPQPGNFSYGYVEGNDARYVTAHQFSQEVRLSSSGGPLEWTVGGFYRNGASQLLDTYEYAYAAAGDLYSGGGVLYSNLYYRSQDTSKSYALFGDATYHLTDRWALGAGVRSFHDDATGLVEYAPGTGVVQQATFKSVDPRASLAFKYADHANVYVSFAKGFRSGGFNGAPFGPYDPEKVYTYELGTKATTAGGMLQLDAAAYFTRYQDMVRRRLVLVSGGYLSQSSNIGLVEVKGLELGLAYRPVRALTLSATGAYLHSEITRTDVADPVNIVGDPTDYTPKLSYTLGVNYDFHWSTTAPGYWRVDYSHRDKVTYIDRSSFFANVLPQASDALNLLDARIGVTFGQTKLELWGLNLTDENKSIDPYQGWANANRTRPRTVGITAGYSF